jgi:hypothetical protein
LLYTGGCNTDLKMKDSTTKFWVQANENGVGKNVPHTGNANYQFIQRETAKEFLNKLRENNPETKFRLVICKEEYTFGAWD